MKTTGIMLQTLCVPCHCRCRYCLLSWDGTAVGCEYERSERYAKRFFDWIKAERPDLHFHFSFGYSMDHPDLFRALDFLNSIGSVGGKFLQMNGFAVRSKEDADSLMHGIARHGVESVNFTFYGAEPYHDRFSGRVGDYRFLQNLICAAADAGLSVSAGYAMTKESVTDAEKVVPDLLSHGVGSVRLFVPHEEGRGALLHDLRCSLREYEALGADTKACLNRDYFKTEAEWLAEKNPKRQENRTLLLSLTPQNITEFEQTEFDEVIRRIEQLDDAYYRTVPDFATLAARYGDPSGNLLYGKRDLYQQYQKRYLKETGITVYDINDERISGSRRY